jgi:hypothetical protein
VREEEEDRPLLKKLGAVRVANGTKRCAWVSGAWTRRRGEPSACVSVAILKPIFKLNEAVTRA